MLTILGITYYYGKQFVLHIQVFLIKIANFLNKNNKV